MKSSQVDRLFLPFKSATPTSHPHAGSIVLHTHTHTHTQQEAAWVRSSIDSDTKTPHVGRWLSACEDSGLSEGLAAPPPRLSSAFIPQLFSTIFIFPLFGHTHTHTHTHTLSCRRNLSGTQISLAHPSVNLKTHMYVQSADESGAPQVEQHCLVCR